MSDEPPHVSASLSGRTPTSAGATATSAALHDPDAVPPASEDIHLPPGTPIPLLIAVGLTLTLVGTTVWWGWTGIGLAIFLVSLVLWIRDTKREVDHLPDEHGTPAHH